MVRLLAAAALAAVAAATVLAGCAGAGHEGGFGVPRQQNLDEVTGERTPLVGTVEVDPNGCLQLAMADGSEPWIVWPPGAEQSEDGGVRADGQDFTDGDPVSAVGAIVTLADLPGGGDPDSYFGSFGGFCGADDAGVAVLDWVEHGAG